VAKKIKRILLISPSYSLFKNDVRRSLPPIGLTYLAAFLRKRGYQVGILDVATEGYFNLKKESKNLITYGLSDKEIKKRISDFNPEVVGVSCIFSTQSKNAIKILGIVKSLNKNIITLMGGSHPTYDVEKILDDKNLDFVILGEGELSTLKLLNILNKGKDFSNIQGIAYKKGNKKFINPERQYVKNIDNLPFPAYDLLDMESYFNINLPQNPYPIGKRVIQLITSRGCPARCVFCTTTNFWGNRYRGRSAKNVLAEVKKFKAKYNIDEIQFTDDNLTLNKKRAIEILDGLKRYKLKWCVPQGVAVWALDEELLEKMKESGCYQLTFAIESGNQYVLSKLIKKPLQLARVKPLVKKAQKLGIQVHAFCICGIPGEKIKQMYETYNFVKDCGFNTASFFAATPLVGSELLSICNQKKYLDKKFTGSEVYYKLGNISTPDFKSKEIENLVASFNKRYNKMDAREKKFEKSKY
jgi:radical SAM superfamily enzyme YgiQ (UPF0313 family)